MRECCRQVETEVVSKSKNKIHETWGPPISGALFSGALYENIPVLVVVEVYVAAPARAGEEGVGEDGAGAVEGVTVPVEPATEEHLKKGDIACQESHDITPHKIFISFHRD